MPTFEATNNHGIVRIVTTEDTVEIHFSPDNGEPVLEVTVPLTHEALIELESSIKPCECETCEMDRTDAITQPMLHA